MIAMGRACPYCGLEEGLCEEAKKNSPEWAEDHQSVAELVEQGGWVLLTAGKPLLGRLMPREFVQ